MEAPNAEYLRLQASIIAAAQLQQQQFDQQLQYDQNPEPPSPTADEPEAAGASSRGPSEPSVSRVPLSRKEEVQRLLGGVLVLKCDPSGPYLAPVVIMSQEESNIFTLLERHIKRDYLLGAEKFWRLVRAELGVETWRPRVQGTQLKALQGARLPEKEAEFEAIQRVVDSLQDCIKGTSSVELLMQDLRVTIRQIQNWWENRNRRPDGGYLKRGGIPGPQSASKRRAYGSYSLEEMYAYGMGEEQWNITDPTAAAAAAAAAGYMDYTNGANFTSGTFGAAGRASAALPQQLSGLPQPAATYAAPAAAAAAAGLGGSLLGTNTSSNALGSFVSTPNAPITLDVGGRTFRTTLTTLLSVQGSLFWQVVQGQGPQAVMQRLPTGEVFIDRSGEQFHYILEYLRACANRDHSFPMPNDARELQALAREAFFYQLPELLQHIQHTSIMPQPSTRTFYDMIYLETGYKNIEQEGQIKEMERAKVVVMQQLNYVLNRRAMDGFAVAEIMPGVAHRNQEDGTTDTNFYYKVLLRKMVPLLPQDMVASLQQQQQQEDGDDGEDAPASGEQSGGGD